MFSNEELLSRWEAQRRIKNIMGIYANVIVQNREGEMYDMLWSKADDASLMFNDGAYVGSEAISGYYASCVERNTLVAKLLQKRLPNELGHLSDEELYGTGPFKALPMQSPVIEIAADGKTAKGLWFCLGSYSIVEACGPVSHWAIGYYAVDFIYEENDWRIWHLQYLNDIDCICGQNWAKEAVPYEKLPEFAELDAFTFPAYTVAKEFRALYSKDRVLTEAPAIPQPYNTFAETFSYGVGKEA